MPGIEKREPHGESNDSGKLDILRRHAGTLRVQVGICYYEAKGLLPIAWRKSGKRMYDESVLGRLGLIEVAKIAGFDLDEIRSVLSSAGTGRPASTWKDAVQVKQGEIDDQMRKLELMKEDRSTEDER